MGTAFAFESAMVRTFEAGRLVIRPGVVEVDGRAFLLSPQTRVEAVAAPPHMKTWLVLLALSLVSVPAAVVAGALLSAEGELSWLVAVPMPIAVAAMLRVLTATTRYHVALVGEERARLVYSSEDREKVAFLVAMLREALTMPTPATPPGRAPEGS